MAVAASRWPGNRSMDVFERSRLVGDAVILERATRVLERVYPDAESDATLNTVLTFLAYQARAWRLEAESGD
jgi:hypothetical protein